MNQFAQEMINRLMAKKTETQEQRITRLQYQGGWIAVDLDGTLAHYDGWVDRLHIGPPIPKMLARVKAWLEAGVDVRIFTARAEFEDCCTAIRKYCAEHLGRALPVTNKKDFKMIELYDDRAVQVVPNTGERADGQP